MGGGGGVPALVVGGPLHWWWGAPQAEPLASSPKRAPGRPDAYSLRPARCALAVRRCGGQGAPGGSGIWVAAQTVPPGVRAPGCCSAPEVILQGRTAERVKEPAAHRSQRGGAHQLAARARARVLPGRGLYMRAAGVGGACWERVSSDVRAPSECGMCVCSRARVYAVRVCAYVAGMWNEMVFCMRCMQCAQHVWSASACVWRALCVCGVCGEGGYVTCGCG